ncbi:hypothetical protein G6L37_04575 [Agrobacterium rubi]|nr:hypothetical protein [Agrobacterium rubi]NTF24628.1 hypothetical protein [Agrobacterium rubi]
MFARCHSSRTFTDAVGRRVEALRSAWTRRRSIREMEAMPFDVRKDIGWRTDI